ncbi:MAG TPA: type II toxin-antitoxin system Phd/YefM family antitoxin [bacterium]|nr:type II toxin-antitoxin system Phd/YefM family antitoxin [bacterium]
MKTVTVAEFKRRFSEFVADVHYHGQRIVVLRRRTPVAALVGLDDLKRLSAEQPADEEPRRGLLGAVGAWADYDGLDRLIEDIYAAREAAVDRSVSFPP